MPFDLFSRKTLQQSIRCLAILAAIAIAYVLIDFSIDIRPPAVQATYEFNIGDPVQDRLIILRQQNLSIVLIKRSKTAIARLLQSNQNLQDVDSDHSSQPDFAKNQLRSKYPEYFVSYATGTDLGCALVEEQFLMKEICGEARYDFAGRALQGKKKFSNLVIPAYQFSNGFRTLMISP